MADTVEKTKEEVPAAVAVKEIVEEKPAPAAEEAHAENGAKETEASNDDSTKLERSIIHQVEYYFGDSNLLRDKFLLGEIAKNEEGWVPFDVLLTFKRLAALTTDVKVIVDALMKSDEGLLEISEDHTKVRRHPERPVPEQTDERRKELMTRTAYCKGFPLDSNMADIVDFFQKFDKVLHVTMRKYLDQASKSYKFKGSVFATFETIEQAQNFVNSKDIKFGERELVRKRQTDYLEEKAVEREEKNKKKQNKKKQVEEKIELPTGSVIYFEGVEEDVTREILREAMEKVASDIGIAFIDFSKGATQGHIRLHGEKKAAEFLEKLTDNKLKLKDDVEITLRTLTDEEEKAYLQKAVEDMLNRRKQSNNKHKKGGYHHGHNRKRRGGRDNEISEKRKRTDDD